MHPLSRKESEGRDGGREGESEREREREGEREGERGSNVSGQRKGFRDLNSETIFLFIEMNSVSQNLPLNGGKFSSGSLINVPIQVC